MKHDQLVPEFCTFVPQHLEQGKLYVSEEYQTAIHLCACGCGEQTVTPFHSTLGWIYTRTPDDLVTLHPSIGNFQIPCASHYFLRENKVVWC